MLREIAAIAFADIGEGFEPNPDGGMDRPVPLSRMPPAARKAVRSVKVKRRLVKCKASGDLIEEVEEVEYKFHSKLDALDKLCRHLGLFEADDTADDNSLTDSERVALVVKILQTAQDQAELPAREDGLPAVAPTPLPESPPAPAAPAPVAGGCLHAP